MSREKIEEMAKVVRDTIYAENDKGFANGFDALCTATEYLTEKITEALYNAGYRKQSEGEWLEINDGVLIGDGKHLECSKCGVWKKDKQKSNFCSNCGAKMKGGAE